MLPPAFLGLSYFLFVECVLETRLPSGTFLSLLLRAGGLGLVLISLVLAGACGYLVGDRLIRPVRLLLQLAESGGLPSSRALFLQSRGREIYELYRLVSVLVNQNKSGARALEELERLRAALQELRDAVAHTGQHGVPVPIGALPDGLVAEIGAGLQRKRLHLLAFFRELRERVKALREEMIQLGETLELDPNAEPRATAPDAVAREEGQEPGATSPTAGGRAEAAPPDRSASKNAGESESGVDELTAARIHESVERLRRFGTVLVLEAARLGSLPGKRAGELFDRFQSGLGDMEAVLESLPRSGNGRGSPAPASGPGGDGGRWTTGSPRPDAAPPATPDGGQAAHAEASALWVRMIKGLDTLDLVLAEVEEQ